MLKFEAKVSGKFKRLRQPSAVSWQRSQCNLSCSLESLAAYWFLWHCLLFLGGGPPPPPASLTGKRSPWPWWNYFLWALPGQTRAAFSQPASHSLTGTLSRFVRKYNFTSSPAAAQTYFPRYSTMLLATGIPQSLQPELSSALSVVLIYFQEMKTHHTIICTLSW